MSGPPRDQARQLLEASERAFESGDVARAVDGIGRLARILAGIDEPQLVARANWLAASISLGQGHWAAYDERAAAALDALELAGDERVDELRRADDTIVLYLGDLRAIRTRGEAALGALAGRHAALLLDILETGESTHRRWWLINRERAQLASKIAHAATVLSREPLIAEVIRKNELSPVECSLLFAAVGLLGDPDNLERAAELGIVVSGSVGVDALTLITFGDNTSRAESRAALVADGALARCLNIDSRRVSLSRTLAELFPEEPAPEHVVGEITRLTEELEGAPERERRWRSVAITGGNAPARHAAAARWARPSHAGVLRVDLDEFRGRKKSAMRSIDKAMREAARYSWVVLVEGVATVDPSWLSQAVIDCSRLGAAVAFGTDADGLPDAVARLAKDRLALGH